MSYPYIRRVGSPSREFPLKVGDTLRVGNPDGTTDSITLVSDLTRVDRKGQRTEPEFVAVTRRTNGRTNKHQIGTPWCF